MLPLRLTTALGAKPPPLTVRVNAGPPVGTSEGEMEVISMPMPVKLGLIVVTGTEAVTLSCAVSLPAGKDGVNVRVTSHDAKEASAKGAAGQAAFPSPLDANETIWKSAWFVPLMVNADVTLIDELVALRSVAFIVGLVVPTTTGPKFTGKSTTGAEIGVPWIGVVCGLPEALSVTLKVALLTAFPGVAGFAK